MAAAKVDAIQWEILEDGTISIKTEAIGPTNHKSADELLRDLAEACGGPVVVEKRSRAHAHAHVHGLDHVHAHG